MTPTFYATGTAALAALLPTGRALLLLEGDAEGLAAELFTDPDTPGAAPVLAMWSRGFDADLDGPGVDDLLARLDRFTLGLRRLRALLP